MIQAIFAAAYRVDMKRLTDFFRSRAQKKRADDPTMYMKTKGKLSDKRDDPTMSLKTHQL